MLKTVIFFITIASNLFAFTLNETYFVTSDRIKLFDIVPNAKYDVTLYKMDYNRYSKRIKSKNLIKLLKKHGYNDVTASSSYIKFVKKSPIDTSKITAEVLKEFKKIYPEIEIISFRISPRGYMDSLPKEYKVEIPQKTHLSKDGIVNIKTLENQKIFFDYILEAKVSIYISNKKIGKGEKVSLLNAAKKMILLDKFRATPISTKELNQRQMKYNTKKNSVLTLRNTEPLEVIKKGSYINAHLQNKGINISFSAKALQNGKVNDIITIQKNDGQKLRAKVIAKNRVEIR